MMHCIAARGARLITTNFYDDFILATNGALRESAQNWMELIFLSLDGNLQEKARKQLRFMSCAVRWVLPSTLDGLWTAW